MGLSFTIAADPRQHSHFQVRVPQDSYTTAWEILSTGLLAFT
jgi:hypothetical protein